MVDQPVDPYVIAQAILTAVATGFSQASVTLPTRQLVIAGRLPAWDGPQVTVALQRVYVGLIGQEEGRAGPWQHGAMTGRYEVQLVRKAKATLANAPRRHTPASAEITSDAQRFLADMRILAGALHTAKRAGTIRAGQGSVKIGPVESFDQQGEMVGMGATVEVQLI